MSSALFKGSIEFELSLTAVQKNPQIRATLDRGTVFQYLTVLVEKHGQNHRGSVAPVEKLGQTHDFFVCVD